MLRIAQESTQGSPGHWTWSIWLDGPDDELDRLDRVRYQLHPTFPEPVRMVRDRSSRFRFEGAGWGEFSIYATLYFKDGTEETRQHWLKLGDGAPTKEDAAGRLPRYNVFLSHSVTDDRFATELASALAEKNISVTRAENIAASARPMAEAVRKTIEETPVGVVIVSEGSGPWVVQETRQLLDSNSFVIPVVQSPGPKELQNLLSGIQSIDATPGRTDKAVARDAADQIAATLKRQGLL